MNKSGSDSVVDISDNEMQRKRMDNEKKVIHVDRGYISLFKDLGGCTIQFISEGSVHPVDFMRKLSNMFDDAGVPPAKRIDLAINALRGSAATWASARGSNFVKFEDFSKAFLDRYWGIEEERAAFGRIQYGNYESGSRSEYLLKLVKENNYLTKPLTESELVSLIIRHFDQQVRRGILNNGFSGIDEIDSYLRELDGICGSINDRSNNRGYRHRNTVNYNRQEGNRNMQSRNEGVRENPERNRANYWRREERNENGQQNPTMHLLSHLMKRVYR